MHKILIPFVACILCTATLLHAQVPNVISANASSKSNASAAKGSSLPCNSAGTFALGTFTGQSNDTALDTIFLCFNDQIVIDHNGDFDVSGDPVPGTPAGVAWAIYNCPPTIAGDNYQTLLTDPCLILGPTAAPALQFGQPNGDITLDNNGTFQTQYNAGQPVLIHFAPVTVDNFDPTQPYENNIVGAPPGPCLNVNIAAAFEVIYLNAIVEDGIDPDWGGNPCVGKFRVKGGYPEWNSNAIYTIDISLQGNPGVKALIHNTNTPNQLGNNADVIFSISQPGVYNVTIEDGKSCGRTFQITMTGCNPANNIVIALPDTIAPPGSQICVPLNVENFAVVGATFSVSWDPTVLQYIGIQNPNPAIGNTFNANNLNTQQTAQGAVGFIIYDQDDLGKVIAIPDGGSLLEICFTVVAPLDSCSPLNVTNAPTFINIENQVGTTVALTAVAGQVCVGFLPLSMAVEVIDTTCLGTASIKVTATGGAEPYDVLITNLSTGLNFPGGITAPGGSFIQAGVVSGTYSVCVIDSNGVGTIVCDTITLDIPIIGATLQNTKRPTCFGDMDGIVTAIVSLNGIAVPNPGPNFTFNWSPANPNGNISVFSNASASAYAVTVTEQNSGCTVTASGFLDQPLPVNDDVVIITPASCPGLTDGGITYVAEGGTPYPGGEYQYNWEYLFDPNTGGTTQGPTGQDSLIVLTGLAGGTWYVTITDANGCSFTQEVDVPNVKNVEIVLTSAPPLLTQCAGDSTGVICVQVVETPATPNPTYAFFWGPIGYVQTTPGGNPLASCYEDLPAGDYSLLAIDAAGCADTAMFTVSDPPALNVVTTSITQPTCAFPTNGSITVIGQGGTNSGPGSYTYAWSPPPATTGATVSNLPPGTYTVTVNDLNGCQDSLSVTLMLPPPPVISQVDSVSVKCGSDGSISVTSPTGVVFQWQTISGQTISGQVVGNTSTISSLQGDTFIVIITDAVGCITSDTFSLAPVTPMSFSDTTIIEPSCFGYDDGSISIGVVNGNPQYNFLWNDPAGQTFSTLINVPAGDYTVTVTDVEGCTLVGTFTLSEPPQIIVTASVPTPVSCFGVCDGAVMLDVQYADGTDTIFNYVWSDIGAGPENRNDLCADTVTVIAIDGNNCFGTDTIIVPGPPEVSYSTLTSTPTTCNGGNDGSATVAGAGGNGGPYTYLWSNGANTATVNGLAAEEYTVTITDVDGCTGVYTVEVTEPEAILVAEDSTNRKPVKCNGGDDGQLAVTVTGGNTGGYTFSWEDATGMIVSTGQIAEDLSSGIYSVTATDSEGCTGVLQNLFLDEPPPVFGEYLPWEELVCFGDETTLYIDTIYGGSGGPYSFSLDFGVALNQDFPVTMSGGEHYITYFDRNLCEYIDTIFVFEPDPILVTFNPAAVEIELGDSTQLKPLITGAVVDTFIWSPTETLHYPNQLTPYAYTFDNETYTLTVLDANGCQGVGSITVEVDPNRNVFMPNIFKPGNASGLNDHFNPQVGRGVELINFMRIYDRWGGLMYERNDFFPNNDNLAEGWDGRYNGDYVNPGVFVYLVEVKFLDGKVLLYRGDVTVVR